MQCIVPRLDALQGRTNGFIREPRVSETDEPDWWHAGKQPARLPAESTSHARCYRL